MAISYVERPYSGRRQQKIAGEKFGSLTALRHVGFCGKMGVWMFKCECGNEIPHIAALVKNAAKKGINFRTHCGCKSRAYRRWKHSQNKHPSEYHMWNRHRHEMCPEWAEDFDRFFDECLSTKSDKYLIRTDTTKPLGPDNFAWSDQTTNYWEGIDWWVKRCIEATGCSEDDAYVRAQRVSHQRRWQLIKLWESRGKITEHSRKKQ